jgi:hypothetical protein
MLRAHERNNFREIKATEITLLLYIKDVPYGTSVAGQTREENIKEGEEKREEEKQNRKDE